MNTYETIALKIEQKIRTGQLIPGEKLPSVRDLSSAEQASPTTVVEAYELLRDRGLIASRERSGYFVLHVSQVPLDPTRKTAQLIPGVGANSNDRILALRQATHDSTVFPFGAASPLPDFFPTQVLNRTLKKIIREEPAILSEYCFPPGSVRLREQIVNRYRHLNVKLSLDSVLTTSGAIEAIGIALAAVAKPGDIVGLETPIYFGIIQLIKSMGYQTLEIPLDAELGLTSERFLQAIKKSKNKMKALVTVSNFSNPIGSLVPDEEKEKLVQIASRNNVVIIEDDLYGDLFFGSRRPKPYQAFDQNNAVITCGSFSKTFTPSLRVGFAISQKYFPTMTYLKSAKSSGVSSLAEETLASFLETEHSEKHLRFLRKEYKTLVAQYSSLIERVFPPGTKMSQPKGGFILWVQLPEKINAGILQTKMLKQKISIAPGSIFSPSQKDYANFIRLNCAIPWSSRSQSALLKIEQAVSSLL